MAGTGSLTLAQYAMETENKFARAGMLGIAREGVIADIINWRGLGGAISETGTRFDEVISPDWIALDGSISSKFAQGKQLAWSTYQMAVHIDIPVALEDSNKNQVVRQSTRQTMLALKGAAYEMNDTFVNGDQASNGNQFEGLNKLVATLGSSQTIGAAEIDLTASYTDALAESLWVRLDQMFHACEGHKPDAVFANDTFLLKLRSFCRQNNLLGNTFNWMEASFNVDDPRRSQRTAATKPALIYQDVPFYDLGVKADQSTKVIGNAYAEGGSAGATRLFAVKFSEEDLEGIQASPLQIKDIGLLEAKEVYRKRLTWMAGLAMWGPRSVVKCQGIKVA